MFLPAGGAGGLSLVGADEAALAVADQVLPARLVEGLQHQLPVLRLPPLHQRPLEGLVVGRFGDEHRLHGPGIQAGVPHTGGQGAGGGVEVLHLLRHMSLLVQPFSQLHRVLQGTARVGGDQVGHQVLVLAVPAVELKILLPELLIDLDVGLAHIVQGVGHTVLRGHLQLSGDVVLDQVGEKFAAGVLHQEVETDARTDEHLFDPGDGPQLPQQHHIVGVIGVQVGTGLGGQTGPVFAHPVLELLLAGGAAEGGGRAAHVVDIALEARVMGQGGHLPDDALVAAAGDGPPLVEGQGAEVARPEAAPVMGDREAHLLDGRDAPHLVVHRVGLPDIGQLGHSVHLRCGQGGGRGIDNQESISVLLKDRFADHCVVFQIFCHVGPGIGGLVGSHLFKGGDLQLRIGAHAWVAGGHTGTTNIGDFFYWGAGVKAGQNLY